MDGAVREVGKEAILNEVGCRSQCGHRNRIRLRNIEIPQDQGSTNYEPQVKFIPPLVLGFQHIYLIYGCFRETMAERNSAI